LARIGGPNVGPTEVMGNTMPGVGTEFTLRRPRQPA
jgi:hypothetical protein